MKRIAAIIGHGCSIWLLLLATAMPDLHCCLPRLFAEGSKEEKEEKGGSCEEQRAKEAVVHVARRHRGDVQQPQLPGQPLSLLNPHPRDASQYGQVCLADGFRGAQNQLNGCGAALLR